MKQDSAQIIQVDKEEFEQLKPFKYSKEYLEIHSKEIGEKNLQQWFQINDLSYWWFVDPIIAPKFDQIALFIDRLEICFKKYNPDILKLVCRARHYLIPLCPRVSWNPLLL